MNRNYRSQRTIDAPANEVFDALVDPRGWWTPDADVATRVGGHTRVDFGDAYVVFRVDRLVRPTELDWTCVAQHDEGLPRPDEWVGTRLSFQLAEVDGGTRLEFVHHGLEPRLECYEACERGWEHFLCQSLERLVETGKGAPWVASSRR